MNSRKLPAELQDKINRQINRARTKADRAERASERRSSHAPEPPPPEHRRSSSIALEGSASAHELPAQPPPAEAGRTELPGLSLQLPTTPPAGHAPRTRLSIDLRLPRGEGSVSGLAAQKNAELQAELERLRYIEERMREEEAARLAETQRSQGSPLGGTQGNDQGSFEAAYRECCANIGVLTAPPPTALAEGAAHAGSVKPGEYRFYKFYVPDTRHHLRVEVRAQQGDPNIYISNATEKPTVNDHIWKSEDSGDDLLLIPTSDPHFRSGFIYLGVIGYGARETEFEITCSTTKSNAQFVTLHTGVASSGQVLAGQYKYYRVKVTDVVFIKFSLEVRSGDADLFVSNRTEFPTADEYIWSSGETGSDSVIVMHNDPYYADGFFHVGVYGFRDALYRVAVRVERRRHADDPQTEAALLAAAEARAEAAAEHNRKTAQGRLEEIRKNALARAELEAACAEFQEAKAARAHSVRSRKAAVDAELEAAGRAPLMTTAEGRLEQLRERGAARRERAAAASAAASALLDGEVRGAATARGRLEGAGPDEELEHLMAEGRRQAAMRAALRAAGPAAGQPRRASQQRPQLTISVAPPATAPPGGRAAEPPAGPSAAPSRRASTAVDPFALLGARPGGGTRRTSLHILRDFYPNDDELISRMLLLTAAARDVTGGVGISGGDGSWGPGVSPRDPLARAALVRLWAHLVVSAARLQAWAEALAAARKGRKELFHSAISPRRSSAVHSRRFSHFLAPYPRRSSDVPLRIGRSAPGTTLPSAQHSALPTAAHSPTEDPPTARSALPSAMPSAAPSAPHSRRPSEAAAEEEGATDEAHRPVRVLRSRAAMLGDTPPLAPLSDDAPPAAGGRTVPPTPPSRLSIQPAPPPGSAPGSARAPSAPSGGGKRPTPPASAERAATAPAPTPPKPAIKEPPPPDAGGYVVVTHDNDAPLEDEESVAKPVTPLAPAPPPRRRRSQPKRMPGRGYVPLTKAQLEKLANVGSSSTMPPDIRFQELIICKPKYETGKTVFPRPIGKLPLPVEDETEAFRQQQAGAFFGLTVDNMIRVKREAAKLWTRAIKL